MARFIYTFDQDTVGEGLPAGWLASQGEGFATPRIDASLAGTVGNAFAMSFADVSSRLRTFSPTAIGFNSGDIEILTRVASPAITNGNPRVVLNFQAGASPSLYFLTWTSTAFQLRRTLSGNAVTLASVPMTFTGGTFYNIRFAEFGNQVRAKIWTGTLADEPAAWTISVTDTNLTSGEVAVGGLNGGSSDLYFDFFTVGTGADSAPSPYTNLSGSSTTLAQTTEGNLTTAVAVPPSIYSDILRDSFTAANNTDLNGRALDLGGPWSAFGDWRVDQNRATLTTIENVLQRLTANAGRPDGDVSVKVTLPASGLYQSGLRVRQSTTSNFLRAFFTTSAVFLTETISGSSTTLATVVMSDLPGSTRTLRVIAKGPLVSVLVDGFEVIPPTETTILVGNLYGLHTYRADSSWLNTYFDDFQVTKDAYEIEGTSTTPAQSTTGQVGATVPVYTLSGVSTTPAQLTAGNLVATPPVYSLSGTSTTPTQITTGTIESVAPVYDLAGISTTPAQQTSGDLAVITPVYDIVGVSQTPPQDTQGSIDIGIPTYDLVGTSETPVQTTEGTLDVVIPVYELVGTSETPAQNTEGSIGTGIPTYDLAGTSETPAQGTEGELSTTVPIYGLVGSSTTPTQTTDGSLNTGSPVFELSGFSTTPSQDTFGELNTTLPVYTLSGVSDNPSQTTTGELNYITPGVVITGTSTTPSQVTTGELTVSVSVVTIEGLSTTPAQTTLGAITTVSIVYDITGISETPAQQTVGFIRTGELEVLPRSGGVYSVPHDDRTMRVGQGDRVWYIIPTQRTYRVREEER